MSLFHYYLGYKMRKHISKAITRRSAAIRTALAAYNKLAPVQKPPRPTLEYSEVASYAFLGDFELLKYSRYDVTDKPWTSALNREVAIKYFKVIRAHEEIYRLNVEIPRLAEWVDHEDEELFKAFQGLQASQPYLACEIGTIAMHRKRVNNVHRARLARIYLLDGYSGPVPAVSVTNSEDCDESADLDNAGTVEVDEDDALSDEVSRLMDCFEQMSI
jgi:hypothetical protein